MNFDKIAILPFVTKIVGPLFMGRVLEITIEKNDDILKVGLP